MGREQRVAVVAILSVVGLVLLLVIFTLARFQQGGRHRQSASPATFATRGADTAEEAAKKLRTGMTYAEMVSLFGEPKMGDIGSTNAPDGRSETNYATFVYPFADADLNISVVNGVVTGRSFTPVQKPINWQRMSAFAVRDEIQRRGILVQRPLIQAMGEPDKKQSFGGEIRGFSRDVFYYRCSDGTLVIRFGLTGIIDSFDIL